MVQGDDKSAVAGLYVTPVCEIGDFWPSLAISRPNLSRSEPTFDQLRQTIADLFQWGGRRSHARTLGVAWRVAPDSALALHARALALGMSGGRSAGLADSPAVRGRSGGRSVGRSFVPTPPRRWENIVVGVLATEWWSSPSIPWHKQVSEAVSRRWRVEKFADLCTFCSCRLLVLFPPVVRHCPSMVRRKTHTET